MMSESSKKVELPEGFVKTRYNGYFWNVNEQALYSIKVKGILRKLKKQTDIRRYFVYGPETMHLSLPDEFYYRVSVNGKMRTMTDHYLKSLNIAGGTIPVDKRKRITPVGKED